MSRERVYGREAIVLRARDYGEADRILSFITPQGRLDAIARGVRRLKSRKAGHLAQFSRVRLMVARGRDLETVTQADCIEQFAPLSEDVELFTQACYVAELVDILAQEDEPQALYRLVLATFRWLVGDRDPLLGVRLYELRLLEIAGYDPEFFACVECGNQLVATANSFSAELGGMLCPGCGERIPVTRLVSVNAQKVLRYMRRHTDEQVGALRVSTVTMREIEALLRMYIQHILEREVRSGAVLDSLRRSRPRVVRRNENGS